MHRHLSASHGNWFRRIAPSPRRLLQAGCSLVVGLALAWPVDVLAEVSPDNPRRSRVVVMVEKVKAAVVNIHSERTVRGSLPEDPFGLSPSQHRVNGMGTGIIIDPRGYIITNQHVVEDVQVLRVRLVDGATYNARVIARDAESDLALLKIDTPKPLPVLPLGTAEDLMVGEPVIAIGNAYGYEHTVTAGVVSAVKRDVTLNKDMAYKSLIQTDASINPGNSGGPLLNIHGELVGVNVAIRAGAQNIGFAIPVDTMIRVAAEMLNSGKRLGVRHGLVVRDLADTSVNPIRRQVRVERIEPGSAAAEAGVHVGDVITQIDNQPIATSLDIERALLDHAVDDRLPLVVRRSNVEGQPAKEVKLELALKASLPTQANKTVSDLSWKKLGLRLQPVAPDTVSRANPQLHGGLVVVDIHPQGLASKAGIQRGDILVGLHQWETVSMENVDFVLTHRELSTFNPVRFFIVRDGQVRRGWLGQID